MTSVLDSEAIEEAASATATFLSGSLRGPAPAIPLTASVTRELGPMDIERIGQRGAVATSQPAPLKRLRHSHHRLARLLSAGMTPTQAADATGYSVSRISILQGDPAFIDLVSHYTALAEEVFSDFIQRSHAISLDILEEMQDRLAESPEMISNQELKEWLKATADRSGNAPITRNENLNVTLSAEDAFALKAGVDRARRGNVQTIEQKAAPNPRAAGSVPVSGAPGEHSEGQASGQEGQGTQL